MSGAHVPERPRTPPPCPPSPPPLPRAARQSAPRLDLGANPGCTWIARVDEGWKVRSESGSNADSEHSHPPPPRVQYLPSRVVLAEGGVSTALSRLGLAPTDGAAKPTASHPVAMPSATCLPLLLCNSDGRRR